MAEFGMNFPSNLSAPRRITTLECSSEQELGQWLGACPLWCEYHQHPLDTQGRSHLTAKTCIWSSQHCASEGVAAPLQGALGARQWSSM